MVPPFPSVLQLLLRPECVRAPRGQNSYHREPCELPAAGWSRAPGLENGGRRPQVGSQRQTRVYLFILASLALICSDSVGSAWIGCDFFGRGLVRFGWIRSVWISSKTVWGKTAARGASQFEHVSPACGRWEWLQPGTEGRKPSWSAGSQARCPSSRRPVVVWTCLTWCVMTEANVTRKLVRGFGAKGIITVECFAARTR